MLKIQEFIRCNSDWECLLSSEPYCISISHDSMYGRDLVMFKYDQIRSDLSIPLVQECRGLILDANTFEVVSFPFVKFFNYGEPLAVDIDWASAQVTQKLDGSIIKVVRLEDGNFLISTNGMIDAFKCSLPENFGRPFDNFGQLFIEGLKWYGYRIEDFDRLFKTGYTYMFELTSPWNQVVVNWNETKAWFIGVRDNRTFKEIFFGDSELAEDFDTPKVYPITSVDECVAAAKALPDDEEGYVVVDKDFNRIKIKSPRYIQLHYMAGNQIWSPSRVMDIIRDNEVSEYVAYFPKFKVAFDAIKAKYDAYVCLKLSGICRRRTLRSGCSPTMASAPIPGSRSPTLTLCTPRPRRTMRWSGMLTSTLPRCPRLSWWMLWDYEISRKSHKTH